MPRLRPAALACIVVALTPLAALTLSAQAHRAHPASHHRARAGHAKAHPRHSRGDATRPTRPAGEASLAAAAAAAATAGSVVPFTATGPWNAALPAGAPLDPNSATIVSDLVGQVQTPYGEAILNTSRYSGAINHAVDVLLPCTRKSTFSWPAWRTDGSCTDANAPIEGERFRPPASLDLSTLNLSPGELMIATAMQRYGAIVTDYAGRVAIQAEDPRPYEVNGAPNPYAAYFTGAPGDWLKDLPYQDLQAVTWNYGQPSP